jgi:hypothetical protein
MSEITGDVARGIKGVKSTMTKEEDVGDDLPAPSPARETPTQRRRPMCGED